MRLEPLKDTGSFIIQSNLLTDSKGYN